jgi:PAS domain S-box-containing protein
MFMNSTRKQVSFSESMANIWAAFPDEFISIWDAETVELIHINDAFNQFFGYKNKKDFIEAISFFGFRKNTLTSDVSELILEIIKRNGNWKEEVLFEKINGEIYLGRLDITTFLYEGRNHFLQRIINIDSQRIFSENLFREIKKFEALFEYATLPILLVNKAGSIILANGQALNLFNYSENEMSLLNVEDLMPMKYRSRHQSHRDGYVNVPQSRMMGAGMELSAIKKSGEEFPVEISLGHYKIDEETYTIVFILDITQRIEIESTLRKQADEMESAKKEIEKLNQDLETKVDQRTSELMETMIALEKSKDELTLSLSKERELSDLKSRFVSMASHEFRTPLSTIQSSVSLIGKYTERQDQEKRIKHIQRVHSAVSNLTDILNDFLSIGKIEEGKISIHKTVFDLSEQISRIVNEINPILKKGQKIQYDHQGPTEVELDNTLISNIMINMLSNASKFSFENSVINIKTEINNEHILISIQDNGLGIADEDKKHLFERFFRGKNVVNIQGTGLGLHIVSKYIEIMNGTIEVESELETGTTFIIKFNI